MVPRQIRSKLSLPRESTLQIRVLPLARCDLTYNAKLLSSFPSPTASVIIIVYTTFHASPSFPTEVFHTHSQRYVALVGSPPLCWYEFGVVQGPRQVRDPVRKAKAQGEVREEKGVKTELR